MGDDQPFYAFRSPGLDDVGAPPARTVEAMAADYLEELRGVQPEGPYYLGGWSLGGLIAMEMARQMQRRERKSRRWCWSTPTYLPGHPCIPKQECAIFLSILPTITICP